MSLNNEFKPTTITIAQHFLLYQLIYSFIVFYFQIKNDMFETNIQIYLLILNIALVIGALYQLQIGKSLMIDIYTVFSLIGFLFYSTGASGEIFNETPIVYLDVWVFTFTSLLPLLVFPFVYNQTAQKYFKEISD